MARLGLDPSDAGTMYVGGYFSSEPLEQEFMKSPFFVRSQDGGQTWQRPPSAPGCFRDLSVDPLSGRVFLACDSIYSSDDRGETYWQAWIDC